jgi:hypothetical protein
MTVGTNQHLRVRIAPSAGGTLPCDSTLGCNTTSYGKVRFLDGSTVIGEVNVALSTSGGPPFPYEASILWTPSTVGSRTITAQYLGSTPNAPSSTSATVNVTP